MKIVHLITRLIIGGAQENTLLSCQGQHEAGHDVTLVTGPAIGPEGSLLQRAQSVGYRVVIVDSLRRAIHPKLDWQSYWQIVEQLRAIRPDIVHTHSSKGGILGRWAAKHARVPIVIHTIHGLAFTASTSAGVNWVYKMLEKQAAPLTTRIVCVADSMRDQSLAAGIGRREQYVTIYSGMETAPFLNPPEPRDAVRQSLGIAPDHIVAGTIARLFDLKGHDDILALAANLCQEFPALRFLWVGDGTLRQRFEQQMRAIGLRDRFILTGMVPPDQVPKFTGAMDFLIHPSRREGLARALPQAGLAGIPAITYDIDGAKEAVFDGVNGYVIPPFDVQRLGDSIRLLAREQGLRSSMGQKGRELALQRFDAQVMVAELEKLYRSL